jgi:hypothetical protein
MVVRSAIQSFVDELERYSKRTFAHKSELGQLMEFAWSSNREQLMEDAVFHAKFVTRAFDIMRRIGRDAEGFATLEAEFKANTEKALTLLRTLVKDSPEEMKQHFLQSFFLPTEENLPRVLSLFAELTWIKNWMVDGKPLPWEQPR